MALCYKTKKCPDKKITHDFKTIIKNFKLMQSNNYHAIISESAIKKVLSVKCTGAQKKKHRVEGRVQIHLNKRLSEKEIWRNISV